MIFNYVNKKKFLIRIIFSIGILFFSVTFTKADGIDSSMCAYVDNSERIFIGNFNRHIQTSDKKDKNYQLAEFTIQKSFRGFSPDKKTVTVISGVYEKRLTVDEIYLVFLRFDEEAKEYRIAAPFPIVFLDDDLGQRKTSSDFKITFGDIPANELDELKNLKVSVSANGKDYFPKFVPGGIFAVVFSKFVRPVFTIEIPVKVEFTVFGNPTGVSSSSKGNQTTIKYDIQNGNCLCDYKRFDLYLPRR